MFREILRSAWHLISGLKAGNTLLGTPTACKVRPSYDTHDQLSGNSQMTSTKITVVFCCIGCRAGYQAQQYRPPVQCFGSFKCQVCRNEVYSWHGGYDYIDWMAIEILPVRRKDVTKKATN